MQLHRLVYMTYPHPQWDGNQLLIKGSDTVRLAVYSGCLLCILCYVGPQVPTFTGHTTPQPHGFCPDLPG